MSEEQERAFVKDMHREMGEGGSEGELSIDFWD